MGMTASELADAARLGAGLPSFYRLARELGVNDSTVANWRHGRATPDDAMTVRLATMAGIDPADALASINAQRCTDPAVRAVWQRIAQRLQHAGAAALAVILSVLVSGTPDAQARASIDESATADAPAPVVQTVYWRAFLRALAAWAIKISPRLPMVPAWDYT